MRNVLKTLVKEEKVVVKGCGEFEYLGISTNSEARQLYDTKNRIRIANRLFC